jgi:hypothetical protein
MTTQFCTAASQRSLHATRAASHRLFLMPSAACARFVASTSVPIRLESGGVPR